jgi:hypothetical protein
VMLVTVGGSIEETRGARWRAGWVVSDLFSVSSAAAPKKNDDACERDNGSDFASCVGAHPEAAHGIPRATSTRFVRVQGC